MRVAPPSGTVISHATLERPDDELPLLHAPQRQRRMLAGSGWI